jgi:hypothetical protein
MLTGGAHRTDRHRRSEAGVTLIELVVAMSAGIVVMIGLFSIMIVTLHQTQRTFTKVDATRQARNALANIENELHSACVDGSPPVQAGSTATSLNFISYFGSGTNPTPVWHQITFNSTGGTVTDSSYTASYNTSGSGANWIKGSLASTTTLLTNVSAQTSGSTTTPVFQYYAYTPEGTDSSGDTFWIVPDGTNLAPGATGTPPNAPLTTTSGLAQSDANNTVEVVINLFAGSTSERLNNPGLTAVDDSVTDAISLRLTTPPDYVASGATAEGYGPCE